MRIRNTRQTPSGCSGSAKLTNVLRFCRKRKFNSTQSPLIFCEYANAVRRLPSQLNEKRERGVSQPHSRSYCIFRLPPLRTFGPACVFTGKTMSCRWNPVQHRERPPPTGLDESDGEFRLKSPSSKAKPIAKWPAVQKAR